MLKIYDVATARQTILKRIPPDETAVPPLILDRIETTFGERISAEEAVRRILTDVRRRGDAALYEWSAKLDGFPAEAPLRVPAEALSAALESLDPATRAALETAASRIREFHRRQPLTSWLTNDLGGALGQLIRPIRRVGLYIPGGTAPLPSSVLMSAIPAQIAGVKEIVVVTPPLKMQNAEGKMQNAQGEMQNAEGERQNAEGKMQNAQGEMQNAQGEMQNAEGKMQNAQGQMQNAEGEMQNAEGGRQVKMQNAEGEMQNAEGKMQNESTSNSAFNTHHSAFSLVSPVILAACALCGITEVYALGGAQAIAALAYGTDTIKAVDKIFGPGNLFVTLAKRQVFGAVGIDGLAGPTETVVIADDSAKPAWVAADLLAQAEHDVLASAILLTPSQKLAEAVQLEVGRQRQTLPRAAILAQSLPGKSGIVLTRDLDEAVELSNFYAPEHLCLSVADPWALSEKITNAGGIFVGEHSFEVLGDYIAGPSHVMPTGGSARFASPLNVWDFIHIVSLIALNPATTAQIAPLAARIARAESLEAHARSADCRLLVG